MFSHRYSQPFWLLLTLTVAHGVVAQDAALPKAVEVQSKLEQWVKTRQLISEEASAWETEKATLAELNEIRTRETAQLDEFVKAAGERVGELAAKRANFSKEKEDLKASRSDLEGRLAKMEDSLKSLIPEFPPALREKIEETIIRLEAPASDAALQDRMRDVLLALQACLEFQTSVTVAFDVREMDGEKREIEILYLGLSRAWYVDVSGKHAGHGVPSRSGWVWTEDNSIAAEVRSAIEIQSREVAPAFVELPLARSTATSDASPQP